MADHSAKIAELEEILRSGVTTTVVDGTTVTVNLDMIQRQLNELRQSHTATADRRPRLSSIQMGGLNG